MTSLAHVQCAVCSESFHVFGLVSHQRSCTPRWCICEHPTVATAYGWTYCGNCQRGLQPNQTQQQEGER